MDLTVSIMSQGAMGAATAARLTAHGVAVRTCLDGRSAASRRRAADAGMRDGPFAALVEADLVLSIMPPGEAEGFARALVPFLALAPKRPVFVDCNAVSPQTVLAIAAIIAPTGADFVDVGIIGGPPAAGYGGPVYYASGPAQAAVAPLGGAGLVVKRLDGPIGAASGLKMSYAGITKGITALGAAMMLAATRFGAADALRDELADSQPHLLSWFGRQVPGMYPKAYRWVAEMDEIAGFLAEDPAAARMLEGAGALFERLARDKVGQGGELDALTGFLKPQTATKAS